MKLLFILLAVLFVAMKLTGFIDWSYWWVTSPIWGMILINLIVTFGAFAFIILSSGNGKKLKKKFP